MKRIISYILAAIVGLLLSGLLFPITCSGQSPALLSYGAGGSKKYVSLPVPPFLPGATVLDAAVVGSSVSQTDLGTGVKFGLIENPFEERLQALQLVGTASAPYKWKSQYDSIRSWVGGSIITAGQKILNETGGTISDWHEWHHFGVKGDPDSTGVGSVIGMGWRASSTGTHVYVSDVVFKNTSFAGIQINDGNTSTSYDSLVFEFTRIMGYSVDGEGWYLGNTNTTTYSPIRLAVINHGFVTNKGRDGIQINSADSIYINNSTVYDVGKLNSAGQRALLQLQNVKGEVRNSVFINAPDAFIVAANGLRFINCVFISTNQALWQDMDLDAGYGASPLRDGAPNSAENCWFIVTGGSSTAIDFREGNANMTFTNCFTNKANLFTDNRVDKISHTLSESGTTTGVSIPPSIQFSSLDPDDEDHGLILTPWYYYKRLGFRTP